MIRLLTGLTRRAGRRRAATPPADRSPRAGPTPTLCPDGPIRRAPTGGRDPAHRGGRTTAPTPTGHAPNRGGHAAAPRGRGRRPRDTAGSLRAGAGATVCAHAAVAHQTVPRHNVRTLSSSFISSDRLRYIVTYRHYNRKRRPTVLHLQAGPTYPYGQVRRRRSRRVRLGTRASSSRNAPITPSHIVSDALWQRANWPCCSPCPATMPTVRRWLPASVQIARGNGAPG